MTHRIVLLVDVDTDAQADTLRAEAVAALRTGRPEATIISLVQREAVR